MSYARLTQVVRALPYSLKERIDGYAESIEASGAAIFADANMAFDKDLLETLVLLAGVRRLWTIVDSTFQVMSGSLAIAAQDGVIGFSLGSRVLKPDSSEYRELAHLRSELLRTFRTLHIERFVFSKSLRDMLALLREEFDGPK